MPPRHTSGPPDPTEPVTESGIHSDGQYYCGCSSMCHGMFKALPRSTYNYHKKYRVADRAAAVNRTYEFVMGGSSGQQNQHGQRSGSGTGNQGDEQPDEEMEWQQAYLGDHDNHDNPDNSDQHQADAQYAQDHEWEDDPDQETREQDRQELADQYHPYWQGLSQEFNTDSDNELDSDDEDDSGLPPLANLQELKISLSYVQYIKAARADFKDSGLKDDYITRLLNPPEAILSLADDPDLELSIGLYVDLGGTSQKSYNKAMCRLRERAEKDALSGNTETDDLGQPKVRKFYTYDQVRKRIKGLSGVLKIKHDMCSSTCMAYTGPLAKLDKCLKCRTSRHHIVKGKHVPRQQFYTIPVGPQLQAFARSQEVAHLPRYQPIETKKVLNTCTTQLPNGATKIDVPIFTNYIHRRDYLERVLNKDIRNDDFVLMMSIDGAQLYQSKQSDCWIYIWVLMDLPPDQRYKKKYVMPGGFIPGPNKPKNVDSFLFPGIQHLAACQKGQFKVWNAAQPNRPAYPCKPFLLHQTADSPGLCYCDRRTGHQGYIGCRLWCPIRGRRYAQKSDTYYPVLFRPNDWMPPGSDHPDVDIEGLLDTTSQTRVDDYEHLLRVLLESPNMDQYTENRRDSGISKSSIFSGLSKCSRLSMLGLFPSALMHLSGLVLTDLLMALFHGTMEVGPGDDKSTWDWAVLMDEKVWKAHGETVAGFKRYLSSSVDRPSRDPAKKINSSYKAKEFLSYVYGMLPALLYGVLPEPYYGNFCDLVWGIRIITQHSITRKELQSAHHAFVNFASDFEKIYVQHKGSRIHFVRQCVHNCIHLSPETIGTGPQNLLSQWVMERTIGNLGEEIKQHSNPYSNLSERGLRRAQVNSLIAMLDLDPSPPSPCSATTYGGNCQILNLTGPRTKMSHPEAQAYVDYALSKDPTFQVGNNGVSFAKHAQLLLLNQQIGRTAWKETQRSMDSALRISRMVKFIDEYENDKGEQEQAVRIGEVLYFLDARINGKAEGLAMLSLCEDSNQEILNKSKRCLWVTHYNSGENLYVVSVESIKSVVSLLPFPHMPGHMFLYEYLGTDVAYLDTEFITLGEDL